MYLGFHVSTCTKRNQISFPSKFRQVHNKKFLITTWFEKSLLLLPYDTAYILLDSIIKDTSSLLPEVRDIERFLYGNAQEVELDLKGRFVLGQELRGYADIKTKAVFVGVKERIELWDYETYQTYGKLRELQIRETALKHYTRITQKFNKNE